METYDLVDALQAHQGQRHSTSCCQASETCSIRRQPHYGIFFFFPLAAGQKQKGPYPNNRLGL